LGAAAVAGAIGCLLLMLLGAPQRMPAMNLAALAVGLAGAASVPLVRRPPPWLADALVLAAAATIPAVALFGAQADGVARWVVVAGLTIQPALIFVPLVAIAFAHRPVPARAVAVGVAALGCAMQPDLGAAAMLALAVAAAAVIVRSAVAATAAVLALAGLAAALRPVGMPPVPFVEQVISEALGAGVAGAALALSGMAMLFVPAVLVWRSAPAGAVAAFAGAWLGALAAALLGPYPTPVLGFGGSAILGYVLSVACLRRPLMMRGERSEDVA
jgi:hypothetical protein